MLFQCVRNVITIISWSFLTKNGLTVKLPQRSEATFYESSNKEGYSISYGDGPLGWSNLQDLFTNTNSPPQLLCITGIWLVYPRPDYKTGDNETVSLISGNDKCFIISETSVIEGMQPLTSLDVTSDSSITLFSEKNFGSLVLPISDSECETGGLKQLTDHTNIGSLIVIGRKSWSLISNDGKALCVRPQGQGLSLCYEPNMIQIEDFHVSAVFPGCPEEYDASVIGNYRLTNCIQFDSANVERLQDTNSMGRHIRSPLLDCYNITWNSTKFTEEESAVIAKLLNIRFSHDFESTEQILWPDAQEDIWKTEPLDTAFDIMIATVPDEIVNVKFLKIIREFTVYHLNEVWQQQRKNGEKMDSLKSWRGHKILVHLMNKCLMQAAKKKDHYEQIIRASYNLRRSIDEFTGQINPALALEPAFDPIIEIAWVVSNYAMALCHHLFEYRLNFWTNFVTTFGHLYFRPLQNRWKMPTTVSPKTFGVILSGFGIEMQHLRIAFATSKILELTPKLDPISKNVTINAIGLS